MSAREMKCIDQYHAGLYTRKGELKTPEGGGYLLRNSMKLNQTTTAYSIKLCITTDIAGFSSRKRYKSRDHGLISGKGLPQGFRVVCSVEKTFPLGKSTRFLSSQRFCKRIVPY
jgi:hypothetical protein